MSARTSARLLDSTQPALELFHQRASCADAAIEPRHDLLEAIEWRLHMFLYIHGSCQGLSHRGRVPVDRRFGASRRRRRSVQVAPVCCGEGRTCCARRADWDAEFGGLWRFLDDPRDGDLTRSGGSRGVGFRSQECVRVLAGIEDMPTGFG